MGSEQQRNQDLKEIYKVGRILEFITFYHNAIKAALLQKYISVKKLVFHYFIFVKKQAFYIKSSIFTTVQFVKNSFFR